MQSTIDQINHNLLDVWQIITGIIGILAFVISVINAVHFFRIRKVNYSVKLIDYSSVDFDTTMGHFQRLRVNFEIVNNSQLPLSITDLKLIIGGKEYLESKLPFIIFQTVKTINRKEYPQFFYNDHLPLQLEPLGSLNCNIVYLIPLKTIESFEIPLNFQIRTNRNTEHECELIKGKGSIYHRTSLHYRN